MKTLATFIIFVLININLISQVSLQWEHHYSYGPMAWGNGIKVMVDSTNTPLVLGQQWNFEQTPVLHIYKINPSTGTVIWDRIPSSAQGQFIFLDSANNIYVSGRIKQGFTWMNPFLAKYTPSGTQLFYTTEIPQPYAELNSSWLDKSGNSYLLMSYNNRYKIVKYDSGGSLIWTTYYGEPDSLNVPQSIIQDNNNDLITSGRVVRNGINSITLLRLTSDGIILDTAEVSLPNLTNVSMSQLYIDASSNIYYMGHCSFPNSQRRYFFMKFNPSLSQLWSKIDTTNSNTWVKFIVQNDGTIVRKHLNGILKYDENGNQLWIFNTAAINDIQSKDNFIYATGTTGSGYFTCKLNQSGSSIWQMAYTYPSYTSNSGLSIAIDTSSNVYVHGTSSGPNYIIGTLKYSQLSGIDPISLNIPEKTVLSQNYPNPFNPTTNIQFTLNKKSTVKLLIYDITGKNLFSFTHKELNSGTYEYQWDANGYSSGIYFVRLITDTYTNTKKMILIK